MSIKHPSHLRELSLACMQDKVTDEIVLNIALESPQIRKLCLTYCVRISGEGIMVPYIPPIVILYCYISHSPIRMIDIIVPARMKDTIMIR